MGKSTETVWTTKEADRLWISYTNMMRKLKPMGLVNLKVESRGEKDFKPFSDEMAKSKKGGDWIWILDFDAFSFEYNVVVGSMKMLLASAKMNTIADMGRRRQILEALRDNSGLVTQSDIDKYFKQVEKRGDIQKIDEDIKKTQEMISIYEDAKKLQKGKSGDMNTVDLRTVLKPYTKECGKGAAYADFMYGVDSGFNNEALMRGHFLKGAKELMPGLKDDIGKTLIKEWADGKGKPNWKPARVAAGEWMDKNVMPQFKKQQIEGFDKGIADYKKTIVQLQAKRARQMGQL